MRCFYCENLREGELSASDFSKNETAHLFKVLRGKTGEKILIMNGKGSIANAEILDKHSIKVTNISNIPEPRRKLHLFMAPPRKQKMDHLLKQCAEIGVWSVNLLITERGVSQPEKESAFIRMLNHLKEGCKQAHNPFLPALTPPVNIGTAINKISEMDNAYFGSTKGDSSDIKSITQGEQNIAWFVGPEGGFSEQEEQAMLNAGIKPLSLGAWIMRIETAAIIGSNRLIVN
jgi:16S rRNA (uracil1498-N3)-methyltransferase